MSLVADVISRRVIESEGIRKKVKEFYSCFISYASQDKAFVTKLYEDLTGAGIRCWLDEKDLKIGDPIVKQISRAIDEHDRVLLVLSEASVKSSWVQREIQNTTALESAKKRTFLFPIRIDDAIFSSSSSDPLDVVRYRHIGDFRNWKQADAYRKSFSRLVRDLAISSSVESGGKGNA